MWNINKIPTIAELQKKVDEDNKWLESPYELHLESLQVSLKLIEDNPDFYQFLIEKEFEDYEITYCIFPEIYYYVKDCLKNDKEGNVIQIFKYLEELLDHNDPEVVNLVQVWFLEMCTEEDAELFRPYMWDDLYRELQIFL